MKKDFDENAYRVLRDCVEFTREYAEIDKDSPLYTYLLELRDLLTVKLYKLEYENLNHTATASH